MLLVAKMIMQNGTYKDLTVIGDIEEKVWHTIGISESGELTIDNESSKIDASFFIDKNFIFINKKIGSFISYSKANISLSDHSMLLLDTGNVSIAEDALRISLQDLLKGEEQNFLGKLLKVTLESLQESIFCEKIEQITDDFVMNLIIEKANTQIDFFEIKQNNDPNAESFGIFLESIISAVWNVFFRIRRYGILSGILNSTKVTDVMFFGKNNCIIDSVNGMESIDLNKVMDFNLRNLIDQLVFDSGRRIDESRPYCDFRLRDGSRVHAIIPPLAIDGPCLTIRRFRKSIFSETELFASGFISPKDLQFLKDCVAGGANIIVSGTTGSGKTTLLNLLASYISSNKRIITVEDAAELQLQNHHVVRLETREANSEGQGRIDIRDLVRNSLRMRPDVLIVGECRGPEAFDMLQSMNTGHRGCMTTIHANSPYDAMLRLETLALMAGTTIPHSVIRRQIKSSIDIIVQISRKEGLRKVTDICRLDRLTADGEFCLSAIDDDQEKIGYVL